MAMTRITRKALVGSVAVVLLTTALVGLSGFAPPDAGTSAPSGTALFANDRSTAVSSVVAAEGGTPPSESGADSFAPVEEQSWALRAVRDLAGAEMPGLEGELDADTPVTRYELAVVLARILEKLQGAGKVIEGPLAKVATLEKLTTEFRAELDMLGVQQTRFTARLAKVEGAVAALDGKVAGLGRTVNGLSASVAEARTAGETAVQQAGEARDAAQRLAERVADVDGRLAEDEAQLQKLGEVVSRVMVKVALADARLQNLVPADAEDGRRDLGALARAVKQVQGKIDEMEQLRAAEAQRVDTLSASLEKVADARAVARPAASPRVDDDRLVLLTDAVSRLTKRLDVTQNELDHIKSGGFKVTGAAVSPKALGEVKELLKSFLTAYEARLVKVEQRAL